MAMMVQQTAITKAMGVMIIFSHLLLEIAFINTSNV
jgi:hypothetical protein